MPEAQRFAGPSDLHLHSNHSDGTGSPAEVVRAAAAEGVRTLALTDHDRTTGWEEAAHTARRLGMTFIPGLELSSQWEWRSVHVLAYLVDPFNSALVAQIYRIQADRLGRAQRIVENIARDYALEWGDVLAVSREGATIGRPHIADALVNRGIVEDRSAAFEGILHPRSGYDEPHYAPHPIEAVRLIVDAGGVAVVAHPAPAGRAGMLPLTLLEELIAAGLAGVEIDHRENTPAGARALRQLAARHDLIVTGSSDYHGVGKPNIPGENTTSDASVRRILERGTGSQPVYPG